MHLHCAGNSGGRGGVHVRVLAAHASGAGTASPTCPQGRTRLSHRSVHFSSHLHSPFLSFYATLIFLMRAIKIESGFRRL